MENINNELLTVNQAVAYMKCTRVFIWTLRKRGLIHNVNAGKRVLILKSSIDTFLKLKNL